MQHVCPILQESVCKGNGYSSMRTVQYAEYHNVTYSFQVFLRRRDDRAVIITYICLAF